jgi:PAS domain S-box-containing protein
MRSNEDLFDHAPVGLLSLNPEGLIEEANARVAALLGVAAVDLNGRFFQHFLASEDRPRFEDFLTSVFSSSKPQSCEVRMMPEPSCLWWAQLTAVAATASSETPRRCHLAFGDISERQRQEVERVKEEARIHRAQKVESLAVLAGGVAHDFNNLLTGVLGYADLALLDLSPMALAREHVLQILLSARRAAELTKQMLAYSGQGQLIIQKIPLSEIVKEMSQLIRVSIPKKCQLRYELAEEMPTIDADVEQLRQVIMNLIQNAAEAVGEKGGVITVKTGIEECDRTVLAGTYLDESLPAGIYVYLEVKDSGCGISQEVQDRVFDPFFSTKFLGRGLGLAAVLGIVRGHHGAIQLQSQPGDGSTFRVLLPTLRPPEAPPQPWQAAAHAVQSAFRERAMSERVDEGTTVLVVDDEPAVREVAKTMLEKVGFKVLLAADGDSGVKIFQERFHEINVVLLDLLMPRMNGDLAFDEIRRIKPDAQVVLSSGYSEQEAVRRFTNKGLAGFLQKPFQMDIMISLMQKVAKAGRS